MPDQRPPREDSVHQIADAMGLRGARGPVGGLPGSGLGGPEPGQRSVREVVTAVVLLAVTLLSATFAGVQQSLTQAQVETVFPEGLPQAEGFLAALGMMAELFVRYWPEGLPFSLTLLAILGTHELGHFFAGKAHRIDVSLPYFIPAPTLIGTFGAVIRMRGPLWHRTGLLDVGAAGPLAGFIVAVPAYLWGMAHSEVIAAPQAGEGLFYMGDSIVTWAVQYLVHGPLPEGTDVMLHPVAFAGWIGLFVTSLNLIPMSQLDGGHIMYALAPRAYPIVARVALVGLVGLGIWGWKGWLFWGLIGLFLGVDRHPPTLHQEPWLAGSRRLEGVAAIALFALTFVPNPFTITL